MVFVKIKATMNILTSFMIALTVWVSSNGEYAVEIRQDNNHVLIMCDTVYVFDTTKPDYGMVPEDFDLTHYNPDNE
jgi:hypothetical protein